jgi:ADP-heptose:LPS heptosyltransferase
MPVHRAVVAVGPRLVALRAIGLGDLLTAVPALRALARAFPEHARSLAAPGPLAPLAELIGWPVVPTGELEHLARPLQRADVLVNLHGRGPQSHRIASAARPRRPLWFEHPDVPASHGSPVWRPGEHEVERWCRLLSESGVPADPSELSIPRRRGARRPGAQGATVIHPGAASAARRWPADRFAAVARAETAAGRPVLVTGSPAERPLCVEVAAAARLPAASVLAGCTDLGGLADVVAAAGRVVCGDTGVAHLATALGTPSVVLFGPTSPREWGPPRTGLHRALWAGGRGDPHARRPDRGLLEVSVVDVVGALERLPARDQRGERRLVR